MGFFFDLNIPISDQSQATKTAARVKLATAAMEHGYTSVAYNRTIRGVMSDRDRCATAPLTLASLLKLSPALSSSVNLHRDRLGVPRTAPFRQFTRLTVAVDSLALAHALNSGNPILKTYDIVSVAPLNQTVFDHACQKLEVDIIAIDFSGKLPFRLKLPMIKAAIQRGVYFEITYSGLLADIQSRRQIIANAKLLVDWTRGKNLIISSAASTVYELRGPYDVANLCFLLGLSMERAKAALSKNCRALITKALRKKQFHKEAVKVELLLPGEQVNFDQGWSSNLLKWDPISSGDGDILLEDLAKSFDAVASKVSTNIKAIDFTSIIDSNRTHGFQLKDVMSEDKGVADTQSLDSPKNASVIANATKLLVSSDTNLLGTKASDFPTPSKCEALGNQNSQILYPCNTKALSTSAIIGDLTTIEEKATGLSQSTLNVDLSRSPIYEMQLRKCVDKDKSLVSLPYEKLRDLRSDMVLDSSCGVDSEREQTCSLSKDKDILTPTQEEDSRTDDTTQEEIGDCPMEECIENQKSSRPLIALCMPESSTEHDLENHSDQDHVLNRESNTVPTVSVECFGKHVTEDQNNAVITVQSKPGQSKAKRKRPHQHALFPLKHKWTLSPFKKPRKSKNKNKMT